MEISGKRLKVMGPSPRKYSVAFKRQIVREYESGSLNKDQLKAKYNIGGNSRILEWCRQYGKLVYPKSISLGRPMKDPQKQRIKELEKALEMANLKVRAYEKLIEITERNEGIEILKKDGAKQSTSSDKQEQA